ncbi:hypothetical protein EVAR_69304_1 [Eumeta japonica]|uniref:BESS domain-containing protein n=1 Tax=Eumeta variegata TaxID=151549 RepID=A0A4C1TGE0_EUMVA|nr:hypothetical protein EVAR_69304_1 [Eumeta japonica]
MQTEKQKYFENCYESDNNLEFVENENLDQAQCLQKNNIETEFLPMENDNISPPRATVNDTYFKSYTISIDNSCVPDNECATILSLDTALHSDSLVKEEPELKIETEKHLSENGDLNELQKTNSTTVSVEELSDDSEASIILVESNEKEHNDIEDSISNAPTANKQHETSTLTEECSSSALPVPNDEDYSFLYSFLSETKLMTQLQKMEFRVNMKNLLVSIFPASASVNILEKQLLLPEDTDPDRKFLISFWPFLESMSLAQNLQFRAKMADVVLQILSSAVILEFDNRR